VNRGYYFGSARRSLRSDAYAAGGAACVAAMACPTREGPRRRTGALRASGGVLQGGGR
jgi:hypothetical protein